MTDEKIKKIKNTAIVIVCVVSVILSAVNYFRPHEKESASEYIVFYETAETSKAAEKQISSAEEKHTEDKPDGKLSINKATKEELMNLPGIGETKAKAIIEYREAYGGFLSIEEITEVKGIGEATLNKFKDRIKL